MLGTDCILVPCHGASASALSVGSEDWGPPWAQAVGHTGEAETRTKRLVYVLSLAAKVGMEGQAGGALESATSLPSLPTAKLLNLLESFFI